jgi:hypothetical protein
MLHVFLNNVTIKVALKVWLVQMEISSIPTNAKNQQKFSDIKSERSHYN